MSLESITQASDLHATSVFEVHESKLEGFHMSRKVIEHHATCTRVNVDGVEGECIDEVNDRRRESKLVHILIM